MTNSQIWINLWLSCGATSIVHALLSASGAMRWSWPNGTVLAWLGSLYRLHYHAETGRAFSPVPTVSVGWEEQATYTYMSPAFLEVTHSHAWELNSQRAPFVQLSTTGERKRGMLLLISEAFRSFWNIDWSSHCCWCSRLPSNYLIHTYHGMPSHWFFSVSYRGFYCGRTATDTYLLRLSTCFLQKLISH